MVSLSERIRVYPRHPWFKLSPLILRGSPTAGDDDFAQQLFWSDHGVHKGAGIATAVVAENGETLVHQSGAPNIEGSVRRWMLQVEGNSLDFDVAVADFHRFAWESHHAFHHPFVVMTRNDHVAADGSAPAIGPGIHYDDLTRMKGGQHAVADHPDQTIPGCQKGNDGESENQTAQTA